MPGFGADLVAFGGPGCRQRFWTAVLPGGTVRNEVAVPPPDWAEIAACLGLRGAITLQVASGRRPRPSTGRAARAVGLRCR
jgi:hypothetical protein